MTTREHVENNLGINWADWLAMPLVDRNEKLTGTRAAWLAQPAGPDRLAALHAALSKEIQS